VERVGDTDWLDRDGDRVVVWAPRPMPEWKIGKHRRPMIVIDGARYAVEEAAESGGGWRYILAPWRGTTHELPGVTIHYGDAYARDREEHARELVKATRGRAALLPLYPLLGFLPRALKSTLHMRYGFEPRAITVWSVRVELAAMLIEVVLGEVSTTTGVPFGGGPVFAALFVVLLLPDLLMRFGSLLDDDYEPYGLYDWVADVDEIRAWWRKRKGKDREP
jgi:hypothetical protein